MFKSGAGYQGFPSAHEISGGNLYLYGLSDFWANMFEDSELVEKHLEQSSILMADAYSKFLQLTSSISIDDIQAYTHSEIRLCLFRKNRDFIEGTTYRMPGSIVSCKYLMTRPLLPTRTMEDGVHFSIDADAGTITFYDTLENSLAPARAILDPVLGEVDTEFALWATDVVIDDDLVFKHFGKNLGRYPSSPSLQESYKDFIRGLMFLYKGGPIVESLEQGLSLALGVPIARETEKVLSVVKTADLNSYVVVTASYSYFIPYDVPPSFVAGDTVYRGDSLLRVSVVEDHTTTPNWWDGVTIPSNIVKSLSGQPYGTESNPEVSASLVPTSTLAQREVYYLMGTFLKNHTFLVKLVWQAAFESSRTNDVFDLVRSTKPSYTFGIYLWEVPLGIEPVFIDDSEILITNTASFREALGNLDTYIDRSDSAGTWQASTAYVVGDVVVPDYSNPLFAYLDTQAVCITAGTSDVAEPSWDTSPVGNLVVDNTVGWRIEVKQLGINSERHSGFFIRGNYDPNLIVVDMENVTFRVPAIDHFPDRDSVLNVNDVDLVPLYNIPAEELIGKLESIGVNIGSCLPNLIAYTGLDGVAEYETVFFRDYQEYVDNYGAGYTGLGYNGGTLPLPLQTGEAFRAYFPDVSDVTSNETIFLLKCTPDMYSVFWVKPLLAFGYIPWTTGEPMEITLAYTTGTPSFTPEMSHTGVVFEDDYLTLSYGED